MAHAVAPRPRMKRRLEAPGAPPGPVALAARRYRARSWPGAARAAHLDALTARAAMAAVAVVAVVAVQVERARYAPPGTQEPFPSPQPMRHPRIVAALAPALVPLAALARSIPVEHPCAASLPSLVRRAVVLASSQCCIIARGERLRWRPRAPAAQAGAPPRPAAPPASRRSRAAGRAAARAGSAG